MIISLPISGQDGSTRVLFCIWKLRIAISCCFLKCFPAIANSVVLIFHFLFSVGARKLSMTGSIRNFERKNFTPKLRILVSLKVKLPDMTDRHILPGLKIDVLIACCCLSVNPQKPECHSTYSASGHLQKFAADLSLSTFQNSQPYKIFTLSLNSNQNLHTPAPMNSRFLSW